MNLNFGSQKPTGGSLSKMSEDPFAELTDSGKQSSSAAGGMNLASFANQQKQGSSSNGGAGGFASSFG